MLKQFSRYFSVGILNTLIHWLFFGLFYYILSFEQSISNLVGFIVAVIFSFFMNAKFTFKQQVSSVKFISYTGFMGILSYLTGFLADQLALPAIFTLVVFSGISLVCGFLYSKFIVFRGEI
ncbi:GtrA family protein [[Pasteurella] aerogenes]